MTWTRSSKSKYGNKPVVVDGVRYASQAEARRGAQLKLLERAGQITDLKMQPRYPLRVNGQLVCTYVGDFQYVTDDGPVTEDVKGMETDVFRIKRKLLKALYGIDVVVVK